MTIKHKQNELRTLAITVISIAVVYAFFYLIGHPIGCIIERVTGLKCLSCGMTSAWFQLMSGNIKLAFYYHPLFWLPPILFLFLFYSNYIRANKYKCELTVIIIVFILFLLVYIYRIIYIPESIV